MKRLGKNLSIFLSIMLICSLMTTNVYAFQSVSIKENNLKKYSEKLNNISLDEDTEMVTEFDDKTLIITVYVNRVFDHKVVTDRLTGEMVQTDKNKKIKKSKISDYLSIGQVNPKLSSKEVINSNSSYGDIIAFSAPAVGGLIGREVCGNWNYIMSAYDSTWNTNGSLY